MRKMDIQTELVKVCKRIGAPDCKGDTIEDTIENLRLCISYLLFDNEAMRREIKVLRKILNEKE